MNYFKQNFLNEATSREDELLKEFMTVHEPITIPKEIKKSVLSIYREELN